MVERKTRITLSMMPGRRHHFQIMALVLACVMPVSIAVSVSPVSASDQTDNYRLYNPNSGEHFYTSNAVERDKLASCGWRYEGVGWVSSSNGASVYRLYNPNAGEHFYTLDASEKNHLVSVGWRYEGVGWYSDASGSIPVYRQYNPNAKCGSHNYNHARLKAPDFSHGDESQKYVLFSLYCWFSIQIYV